MLTFSDKALAQIKKIINDKNLSKGTTYLRVSVIGGGCSGMSYKLNLVHEESKHDVKIEQGEVKILVDKTSMLFLNGVSVDFEDGLNGHGFVYKNPNAKRTCGCGISFS